MRIYTVGHSNRTIEAFLRILEGHGIESLADVRTLPGSRHNPQFNAEALEASLREAGVRYAHLLRLGGLRKPRADSRNLAWRNRGFRGFADYMETDEFETGLRELFDLSGTGRTVIMCAEAVWWRCHRSLISDALVARGIATIHLLGDQRSEQHRLTRFATIGDNRPRYPADQPTLPHGTDRRRDA